MRYFQLAMLGCLATLLATCSGGDERPTLNLQVYEAVREYAAAQLEPKTVRPPLTRAALDELEGAFQEIVIERNNQLAYLYVGGVLQDPSIGTIVTWRSEDNVALTLRNGVLIAMRGIGGDLISSDVSQAPSKIGPVGGGERRMFFLARDNQSIPIIFACEVETLGTVKITIVERTHRTRHVRERCEGQQGQIVNDYWIDSHDQLAWQSRQWAGPDVGYVRFRRLTN